MRGQGHNKKRKKTANKKKQWRDSFPKIHHIAAALYWFVRLVLMLIDWFKN